ncbi:DUF397 domain-containing protein [Spirillospora sp. NPDC029432]|uniref:DUF397 domain-containing protein n=1 Tax=Spirillospora sp. NPDC029432 TaxID=3154599 RepID=UPI0034550B05
MTSPVWRKSTRSTEGTSEQCVEIAQLADGIGVRDSKNPDGPNLLLSHDAFRAFAATLKK